MTADSSRGCHSWSRHDGFVRAAERIIGRHLSTVGEDIKVRLDELHARLSPRPGQDPGGDQDEFGTRWQLIEDRPLERTLEALEGRPPASTDPG